MSLSLYFLLHTILSDHHNNILPIRNENSFFVAMFACCHKQLESFQIIQKI